MLPNELSATYTSNGYEKLFDVAVSYSSIEHSGLTRYGDAPHPWGDLVTLAKIWCYLKDDGMAFIGVPTEQTDSIYFNAHRYDWLDNLIIFFAIKIKITFAFYKTTMVFNVLGIMAL